MTTTTPPRRKLWTWTLGSVVLIVIGALLAPAAVLANWTQLELSSTDAFVDTLAPLARDGQVQDYVAAQATDAILDSVDIDSLTADLVDGIAALGLPPKATAALGELKGALALGVDSLVERTVTSFVKSDAFATVFETALRTAHEQLVLTLGGDPSGAVTIANGQVGLQLGPIIASVKKILVAQGLGFAKAIPAVNKTIVIVKSDQLATAQQAYGITVTIGVWAPLIALAFLVGGILLALRRRIATVWAAGAVAFTMILTIIALDLGKVYIITQLLDGLVPAGVARVIFEQITAYSRNTAFGVAVLALLVGLVAFFLPRLVTLVRRLTPAN